MRKTILCLALSVLTIASVVAQTTWKSGAYKPEPFRKVMVLARVSDASARQHLEDYTVKFLTDKKIDAITAYANVKKTNVASREEFLAIADSLQVDALLVYTVDGAERYAESKPTVSVGVGVGGMYGGYVGASAPISGGVKMVTVVSVSGNFYTRGSTEQQWTIQLSGKYDGYVDKLAYSFAKTTAKSMLKEGLFIPKK
jgi:hypothetical protein